MDSRRMPVIFSGHGDPMIALRKDEVTEGMKSIGDAVIKNFGKPKAILSISAHWYTEGSRVQTAENPKQIYDMYGFPRELYEVKYPVKGCRALSDRVEELLSGTVREDNSWGIDHGTWTVLVHMFPDADIPVVQLSVDGTDPVSDLLEIGKKLAPLRDEGYLIFGSGNVVHNLRRVEWENPDGTEMTKKFNAQIIKAVLTGDTDSVVNYKNIPDASYAVPTPDHYLPLVYCIGAADGDSAQVYNNVCSLGSMAMTGFAFGLE